VVVAVVIATAALLVRDSATADESGAVRAALLDHIATNQMSAFQRGLLADGALSDEEYEQAFAEFRQCVVVGGGAFVEGSLDQNADGVYRTGVTVAAADAGFDRLAWGAVWDCRREYLESVQQWRVADRVPLPLPSAASSDEAGRRQWLLDYLAQGPMSEFQRGLLGDGVLSESEYDLAFAEYARCATNAGGVLTGGSKDARGIYPAGVTVAALADGVPDRESVEGVDRCRREFFDAAQQWRSVERGPGRSDDELFLEAITACMRQSGLDPGDDVGELTTRLRQIDDERVAAEVAPLNFALLFCSLDLAPIYGQPPGSVPGRPPGSD
jgi:hypothetical protein